MNIPNEVKLEEVSCPLCEDSEDIFVLQGHDKLHGLPGEFNIVRCNSCGLMRTNPRPTKNSIGYYYPENYGPYVGSKVIMDEPNKRINIFVTMKELLRRLMDSRSAILPKIDQGRMLEVGCASGSFLYKMAKKGWSVEGIEFSEEASRSARGLGYKVHTGPLETAPEPIDKFDLIVGWMVLEHLHDPVEGLKKLRDWSKPEAWLVVSVPNAASLEFKIFKEKWYGLHLPNHLFHFTPYSIKNMLAASGWKVERVYHQRVITNLIVGLGYVLQEKGMVSIGDALINFPNASGKWHYVLFPISWILSLFGQTGRMTIHAKREL